MSFSAMSSTRGIGSYSYFLLSYHLPTQGLPTFDVINADLVCDSFQSLQILAPSSSKCFDIEQRADKEYLETGKRA